jgi:hypothetical protein
MGDPYADAQNLVERISILSRLAPMVHSDEEYGIVLATLMEVISESTVKLRGALDAMARGGGE